MALQWNRVSREIFKPYCPLVLKQVENAIWVVQTDCHEAILTSATWKSVTLFLSEEHKCCQHTGKASSSWRNKPLPYSETHFCFSIYIILHLQCDFTDYCGAGMKLLDSKQIFPAILNLSKTLLSTLVILNLWHIKPQIGLKEICGTKRNLPWRWWELKDHYLYEAIQVYIPYHKQKNTNICAIEGLDK